MENNNLDIAANLGYTAGVQALLLGSPALDCFGQMALDEALLESSGKDSLTLRLYRWSGPAASFGYFQAFEEAERGVRLRRKGGGLELVRRLTGGGFVRHDGDITFSLVFPWGRLSGAASVYRDIHRGVHLALKAQGLASRLWEPSGGRAAAAAACFAGPSPMDLVHEDGTKFLGGALRRRRGVGLYQGSMRPEGFEARRRLLEQAVVDGVGRAWEVSFQRRDAGPDLLERARRLEPKYRSVEWNRRMTETIPASAPASSSALCRASYSSPASPSTYERSGLEGWSQSSLAGFSGEKEPLFLKEMNE